MSASRSAAVLGSIDFEMTVSGKSIPSMWTRRAFGQRVSPVFVKRMPSAPTISPGPAFSIGSRSSACMR